MTPPYNRIANLFDPDPDPIPPDIPTVADAADRDLTFPNPVLNQRVENRETGMHEIWNGAVWIPDLYSTLLYGHHGDDSAVVRQYPGGAILSVIECGAVGDGSVDDSDAILKAIVKLADTGGVVFFPPGTYRIDETVEVFSIIDRAQDHLPVRHIPLIKLLGAGSAYTRLVGGERDQGFIDAEGPTYFTFEGLTLSADRTDDLPAYGISIGTLSGDASWAHTFIDVAVTGQFAQAGIMVISPDPETFHDMTVHVGQGKSIVLAKNHGSAVPNDEPELDFDWTPIIVPGGSYVGSATLTSGTATVNHAHVFVGATVLLTRLSLGIEPGTLSVENIVDGSFDVVSNSSADNGMFGYQILKS